MRGCVNKNDITLIAPNLGGNARRAALDAVERFQGTPTASAVRTLDRLMPPAFPDDTP